MRPIILSLLTIAFISFYFYKDFTEPKLPIIAIANYGPHSSLDDTITGIKEELKSKGYIENKNIIFDIEDVSFDSALIPQMITKLYAKKPTVMITLTTPVSQFAKNTIKDTPIIFAANTDPIQAGLLKNPNKSENNFTCSADKQDLELVLQFAKKLLPKAKKVGVLYSTAEANDFALIKMLDIATKNNNMDVVAIAIDQPRDIPMRMQKFKDNVDFIYVGTSGPIQPALPTIISEANKMNIPIINVNEEAVKNNQVLASYGVDYIKIGRNTGDMVVSILNNNQLPDPIYPLPQDHRGYISLKKAKYFHINIPTSLENVSLVEE
ncbi:MAG: ABC transporter substrate-binding protein [Pseudomonadota bacterium]